jgi:hypothetical protein
MAIRLVELLEKVPKEVKIQVTEARDLLLAYSYYVLTIDRGKLRKRC